MLKKKEQLKACFGKIWSELTILYGILNFKVVIVTFFLLKIWPLIALFIFEDLAFYENLHSFLRIWPFLKIFMVKFGLFYFFDLASLVFVCFYLQRLRRPPWGRWPFGRRAWFLSSAAAWPRARWRTARRSRDRRRSRWHWYRPQWAMLKIEIKKCSLILVLK